MKNLLNLTLIFTMLLMSSCSSDDSDSTQEPTAISYKIDFTTELSDADSNFEISVITTDDNGDYSYDVNSYSNVDAYTVITGSHTSVSNNIMGVKFDFISGGNFLSNNGMTVTRTDTNETLGSYLESTESLAAPGGSLQYSTLTIWFDANDNSFSTDFE